MPSSLRRSFVLQLLAVACLTMLVSGCVKYKQTLTVQPDGSGRMDVVMGMSNARLAALGPDRDPFARFSTESLAENPQGFVAFSEPRAEDRDGFRMLTVTGWFEDVNELSFAGGVEGASEAVTYALEEGVLTVTRPMARQAAAAFRDAGIDLTDEGSRRVLAPEVAGLELAEVFAVPGRVTAAGPLEADGSEAAVRVRGDAVLDRYPQLVERFAALDQVEIRFEPREWSSEAEDAWRQELADAKAAWARQTRRTGQGG